MRSSAASDVYKRQTFYGTSSASQGVAQAKAVIFSVIVVIISSFQLGYTRKREVQQ